MNIMCLMHQSDRYGYLLVNGSIPLSKDVSRLLRVHHKTYDKSLIELITKGVLCRDENGCIFCARMIKDEHIRDVRRSSGKLGGSPLLKQMVNQTIEQKSTPSSSSSSSNNNIPYSTIVGHLNSKANKDFKHTTKGTKNHIRARWNDGYRLDDFLKVIDKKVSEWGSNPEMVEYLRPQTLFGTKFEAYLQTNIPKQKPRIYDAPKQKEIL